ncbi:hypothetical protein E4U17_005324 [Claviceps sp. LM77 group G4]|nr:hypothetical protein E4U17_005324 [Claviceps sp. LM77 group G4]KAG6071575.1 hypothetical protein E4U33_003625 [Claviceps sp. LM78 group G4]KAG6075976.1 hypothetical protein E4U16_003045 [Claviceps sp. LM84 group G4]
MAIGDSFGRLGFGTQPHRVIDWVELSGVDGTSGAYDTTSQLTSVTSYNQVSVPGLSDGRAKRTRRERHDTSRESKEVLKSGSYASHDIA